MNAHGRMRPKGSTFRREDLPPPSGPWGWLLSDRGRRSKAAFSAASALILVAWGTWRGSEAIGHFSHVAAHPERSIGLPVACAHVAVRRGEGGEIRCGPFVLAGCGLENLPEGEAIVSFRGRLETGNRIRLEAVRIHRWEFVRLAVSAIALALVAACLGRDRLRGA